MPYTFVADLFEYYDDELGLQGRKNRDIWLVDSDATYMAPKFSSEFPERTVEVGIAEQNLVGVAAGIASTGKTVFANTMANFLILRALEQIKVDVVYNDFKVNLVSCLGGVRGGAFGPTHHGLEDIGACRSLPSLKIVVPSDEFCVRESVAASVGDPAPIYIRLDRRVGFAREERRPPFEIGRAIDVRDGSDLTLIGCGSMVGTSLEVSSILKRDHGISAAVLEMHTVKPVDADAVRRAAQTTGTVVTLEEHQITGGLGSAVAEVLAEDGASSPFRLARVGFGDAIPSFVGTAEEILEAYGLRPAQIAEKIAPLIRGSR